MPAYDKSVTDKRHKLLLVGDSGMGKTSMIATLANAGYKVRILDIDNNLAVMQSYLKEGAAERIVAEPVAAHEPASWDKLKRLCENWKTETEDLGPVTEWDEETVLVIDSGTFACMICLDKIKQENKVVADKGNFDQSLWNTLGIRFETWIAGICSAKYRCHLVMNVHLEDRPDQRGIVRTKPYFMGRHLPKVVPSYFNNTWQIDQDKDEKRHLVTQSTSVLGCLRSSAPNLLKAKEELDVGLLFRRMELK